jgi:hypothetical protein
MRDLLKSSCELSETGERITAKGVDHIELLYGQPERAHPVFPVQPWMDWRRALRVSFYELDKLGFTA